MNGKKIIDNYFQQCVRNEDKPVLKFLESIATKKTAYLEVGSGIGRFPILLETKVHNLEITCLEINEKLANDLGQKGFNVVNESILNSSLNDNSFDIVHCSHVIEHFCYPAIATVLDQLIRITKTGGYIIIRSPLMHPGFYNEIDHVRPYSPKTILTYVNNIQQQKQGAGKISLINDWSRREAVEINSNFIGVWYVNLFLKLLWTKFYWPKARANGYVAIFRKEST